MKDKCGLYFSTWKNVFLDFFVAPKEKGFFPWREISELFELRVLEKYRFRKKELLGE